MPAAEPIHVYVQSARPPNGRGKQPPNRPVGIGVAWFDIAGEVVSHQATAYARSDDAFVAIVFAELQDRLRGAPMVIHTTVTNFAEQLDHAEWAVDHAGMTTSKKQFNAVDHYRYSVNARRAGALAVSCDALDQCDNAAFRRAYELAHGTALSDAKKHALQDSAAYAANSRVNLLLSWDRELLFQLAAE